MNTATNSDSKFFFFWKILLIYRHQLSADEEFSCIFNLSKSYRELGRKIQVHHNTVKKYLTKMGVSTAKPKNPHLKPQHVNNPSSKLGWSSWRKTFSLQNRSTNVWRMTTPISRLTAISGNRKVIILSLIIQITQQQRMSRLFTRPSSQRRFCWGWLSVKAQISEPVFFKASYPNVYQ
jgi:hypothetical protein